MKEYWEIPGPSKAPKLDCIAFYKFDGSNMRFEWSKKRGWYKFGTRYTLYDETSEEWGQCIPKFLETCAEDLEGVFRNNKKYRGVDSVTVFAEYFGPSSFCGWHDYDELARGEGELGLFDVNINKKGFVLPRDFVKDFGHLRIPEVIYRGRLGKKFIKDVQEGKYPNLEEGVVCKGVNPKNKNPVHGLWMTKIKTLAWLQKLKVKASECEEFRKVLADNLKEQEYAQEES